jgi:HPt (histidine-containing phosphotransfer) domain-containing protein
VAIPIQISVNLSDEVQIALDVQQLNRSTFGDRGLRAEIVRLFTVQLVQTRARVVDAENAQDWRFVMHTLKGAASAVGALELAYLAAQWESQGLPADFGDREKILSQFDRAQFAFAQAIETTVAV